jgi:hypothetical protein
VPCADGAMISLSELATRELDDLRRRFRITVDNHLQPLTAECAYVNLLVHAIAADHLCTPPLPLIVPVNYPKDGAKVPSHAYDSISE